MKNFQRGGIAAFLACVLLIAALLPAVISFVLAQRNQREERTERLNVFADAALAHAEHVTRELSAALADANTNTANTDTDTRRTGDAPCSPANLKQLRQIARNHPLVRDAGAYDTDNHWQCSALLGAVTANTAESLTLPPPDWRGPDGLVAWFHLAGLPGGRESLVLGRAGYYIAADPAAFVNDIDETSAATVSSPRAGNHADGRTLGVINTEARRVIANTPSGDPTKILAQLRAPASRTWLGENPYVIRRSSTLPIAVVAGAGRQGLLRRLRTLPWFALGAGALAGLAVSAWLGLFMVRRLSPLGQLNDAVRRHQFIVAYQPIVDLATRQCIGAEALVRWKHQNRIVRPDHFIPLAEHRGLIQAITDQILDTILLELGEFLSRYGELYVSINLSAPDLVTPRFLDRLTGTLAGARILPQQIRIEATERCFLDAAAAKETIQAFRDAGHPVYIDDFGTGYSSLSHLQNFQVDALKIDKSFIDTVGQDAASSSVASHIIDMAKTLRVQVIAEGIEREEQASYLQSRGACFGQGWLFSEPLSAADFIGYVRRNAAAV